MRRNSAHGVLVIDVPIRQIKVGKRHRKDMGDVKRLARSIKELGLLQPLGITEDRRLVFGERRLRAVRDVLKWKTIPARIIAIDHLVAGEHDENEFRKNFTVSERIAIAETLERLIPERRGNPAFRQKIDELRGSRTDVFLAKTTGFGNRQSYRQARKVIEQGSPKLILAMDEGRVSISAAAILSDAEASRQDAILDLDERAIIQAAKEIQQRRLQDKLARPARRSKGFTTSKPYSSEITCGDCFNLIPTLKNKSVQLILTSPPYAQQRKAHYVGVSEARYPAWTVEWMRLLKPKLTSDGSVLIVIRPHLRKGVISDYVLRTRLALREAGFYESEECIWLKPGSAPLGSVQRPRRAWESILWFSQSPRPYCNPKACGRPSQRLGFQGSLRLAAGNKRTVATQQNLVLSGGQSRGTDVFVAALGSKQVDHPAVFPVGLAEQLIQVFSRRGDLVIDPFAGAGTTGVAAKLHQREYRGFEIVPKYARLAKRRVAEVEAERAAS